jgi:hypothetical protein
MPKIIEIADFAGVVTNADSEDLAKEILTSCKNMRIVNGKLVKTFAFGNLGLDALASLPVNIGTFTHSELAGGHSKFAIFVNASTFVVTVKAWNTSTSDWEDADDATDGILQNSLPTIYQRNGLNPFVYDRNIIRLLPGNVGKPDGTNQAKALWIGHIDRDLFDEQYVADTDYDSGFYAYPANIDNPVITSVGLDVTVSILDGGSYGLDADGNPTIKYYRLSYVYDGIQESLLSAHTPLSEIRAIFTADTLAELSMMLDLTDAESVNHRLTGINVYRADNKYGTYYKIQAIDFLRKADKVANDTDGAYWGANTVYIPALSTYEFSASIQYAIIIQFNFGEIQAGIDGAGHVIFYSTNEYAWNDILNFWNATWELVDVLAPEVPLVSGADGAYAGSATAIVSAETGDDNLIGGLIRVHDPSSSQLKIISGNFGYAILCSSAFTTFSDFSWQIADAQSGAYFFNLDGTDLEVLFYDDGLADGAEHYAQNEVSINVNGKFALISANRLWQANIVLDPGGDDEEAHKDWISYSEFDLLDVNPVSNVIPLPDREGGEIMGIAESFGSLLIFKKFSHFRLTAVNNTDGSLSYEIIESKFNAGCVAPNAIVQDGNTVYFCASDGIYRTDANIVAQSEATPMIANKISEPINDIYEALTDAQKAEIIATYDKRYNELLFCLSDTTEQLLWAYDGDETDLTDRIQCFDDAYVAFGYSPTSNFWAFNLQKNTWRKIEGTSWPSLFSMDENSDVIFLDELDSKVYGASASQSVGVEIASKTFFVSDERKDIVRFVWVTYKSATPLTVNLYTDDSDTVAATGTLAASTSIISKIVSFRYRCNRFKLQIIDESETATETEIHKIKVEHE